MRDQQVTYQGLGKLRPLLSCILIFAIWQQCRALPPIETPCRQEVEPTDCNHIKIIPGNNCRRYVCIQGVREVCNNYNLICADGLNCHNGQCMGCVGDNCHEPLCPECRPNKRLPNRMHSWYHRARLENPPQKYIEPSYDDETIQYT